MIWTSFMTSVARSQSWLIYLGLGLLQGLTVYSVMLVWRDLLAFRPLLAAVLTFVLILTAQLQLLWNFGHERRVVALVFGCASLFAALAAWYAWQYLPMTYSKAPELIGFSTFVGSAALLYILTPFIQSIGVQGCWRFQYADLYPFAWNNGLILVLSGFLVGVSALVLLLWAGLFAILGIKLFGDIFASPVFLCLSIPACFATGIHIGLERERVIDSLRSILLAMCRVLLPLTVLIIVLFLACLPFTGLEPLWQTKKASAIVFCLISVHLLFVNGVFQDGRQQLSYLPLLRRLLDASLLGLPILAVIACYSLWLRIEQYGLTAWRVLGAALLVVILAHALALALAVVRRGPIWLASLQQSNPLIALAAAVLLVLLQTPLLSPLELSARNQYQRLLDGRVSVENVDLSALKFALGEPGQRYLARIEAQVDKQQVFSAEQIGVLRPRLQVLRQSDSTYAAKKQEQKLKARYEWLGPELAGARDWFVSNGTVGRACEEQGCYLWAVDLDSDGLAEVLLWANAKDDDEPQVYAQVADGKWRRIGEMRHYGHVGRASTELLEAIRRGETRLIEPTYKGVKLGARNFEMQRYE
jgi:hypothetical protein